MNSNVIDLWTRRPIEADSLFWPDTNPVRVEDRFRDVAKGAHCAPAGSGDVGKVEEALPS